MGFLGNYLICLSEYSFNLNNLIKYAEKVLRSLSAVSQIKLQLNYFSHKFEIIIEDITLAIKMQR